MGQNYIQLFLSRGPCWPEYHMFLIMILNLLIFPEPTVALKESISLCINMSCLKEVGTLISILRLYFPSTEHRLWILALSSLGETRGAHRKIANTSGQDCGYRGVEWQYELWWLRGEKVTVGRDGWGTPLWEVVPKWSLREGKLSKGKEGKRGPFRR